MGLLCLWAMSEENTAGDKNEGSASIRGEQGRLKLITYTLKDTDELSSAPSLSARKGGEVGLGYHTATEWGVQGQKLLHLTLVLPAPFNLFCLNLR